MKPMKALKRFALSLGVLAAAACSQTGGLQGPEVSAKKELCDQVGGLLLVGQRNSFGLKFSEAEDAFSELLTIYSLEDVTGSCPKAPSRAFILMNQALAYSSQERFVTADGLFDLVSGILESGEGISPERLKRERALFTAYRAQDLLNRSSSLNAREFADAAAASFPTEDQNATSGGGFDQLMLEVSDDEKRRLIDEASNSHARAHILLLEGELDEATDAINYALDLVNFVPRSAAVYRPRFLAERALINFEKKRT